MKKLITLAIVSSMLISAPVLAKNYDRTEHREHKQKRKSGCGWLCGAIIGGVVVGVLASKERAPEEDRNQDYNDTRYYPPDYRYDRRYCVREQITEWRYGRRYVYWETTCN